MVEEIIGLIDDISKHCESDEGFADSNKQRVDMYMTLIKEALGYQHKLIYSYESITKKLED